MRILLVNDYGTETGGAEVQLLLLRRCLRERGHDARLFTSRARPRSAPLQSDDTCFGTVSTARTPLQVSNPWAGAALRKVIAAFKPDVVHVGLFLTQLSPSILPALRDVPALYHVHWYRAVCPLGTKRLPDGRDCTQPWGVACLRNRCLRPQAWVPLMVQRRMWHARRNVFDRYIACSQAVRARLTEAGFADVAVVWNGVAARPARPPLREPPTAAFAGRLVPEKGALVLVDAFARVAPELPGCRLILAGDGPERPAIERRIRSHGLADQVLCTGWLQPADLEAMLQEAWVQVSPSLWAEPFGLTIAEGMMRGTAAIAFARGGPAELVQHERTGLLVEPGSVDALAHALRSLLGDRERAERMGTDARLFAREQFTETIFTDRMIENYTALMPA
ncbi:MAG: glycosyltransferase family 4 protein [Longimicrobiales bacterium]